MASITPIPLHNDLHKGLKADYILANPPFNISDWGGKGWPTMQGGNTERPRWECQLCVDTAHDFKACPDGIAGFVLANGSLSTNTSTEGEIRKNIIEDDLVGLYSIAARPVVLFRPDTGKLVVYNEEQEARFQGQERRNPFIDARKLGYMADRTHRELSDEDIRRVAAYHAWRGEAERANTRT